MIAVKTTDLSVKIDQKTILQNVDIEVVKGEFVSLIGANGSGKTTLLKTICRLINQASGSIQINGRDINSWSSKELAKEIGYVAQFNVIPDFTVLDFVLLSRFSFLKPFGDYTSHDKEIAVESLKTVFAEDLITRKMNTLSGGERQRIIIASALSQQCKIILLDEPTTYLDPKYQLEINELIRRINRDLNLTIINVTHDINSACLYSDRIYTLKKGKVVANNIPEEIYQNPQLLTDIFETPFQVFNHQESHHQVILNFRVDE